MLSEEARHQDAAADGTWPQGAKGLGFLICGPGGRETSLRALARLQVCVTVKPNMHCAAARLAAAAAGYHKGRTRISQAI